ncbi:MAG: glycoside hydrolase family 18 protein [Niabella sp.]
MKSVLLLFTILLVVMQIANCQETKPDFRVIAYYGGSAAKIDSFPVEKLTHIIYSFCHLKGNKLSVGRAADSLTIQKLVSLKSKYPKLKVLLSLGGWGGCASCSEVFATPKGRRIFARSVRGLKEYFHTDGVDLDWEYPAIEGFPGHRYSPADREHFTLLVKALRKKLGRNQEISFAAGGFSTYLEKSIDWKKVMPIVNYVNLMTYDLVHGASSQTGHLTSLYSTTKQKASVHDAVSYLDAMHVPRNKLIIGAAFYGRTWDGVANINNGLYQAGVFKSFIPYNRLDSIVSTERGFIFYYDSTAKANYAYNSAEKIFATFDDKQSIAEKTRYAVQNQLGGIMFWELGLDKNENGYLDVIDNTLKSIIRSE